VPLESWALALQLCQLYGGCQSVVSRTASRHLQIASQAIFSSELEQRYNSTGGIQTMSILKSPAQHPSLYYYVPLIGLSLNGRRLAVPATSLEMKLTGFGGTIVDSGSTIMLLVEPAFKALKKAVLGTVKLPVANRTVEDYKLRFASIRI